jgi:hypothetical protein
MLDDTEQRQLVELLAAVRASYASARTRGGRSSGG